MLHVVEIRWCNASHRLSPETKASARRSFSPDFQLFSRTSGVGVTKKNSIKILRVQLLPFPSPSPYCASVYLCALCLSLATTASWYNFRQGDQKHLNEGAAFFCNPRHHSEHDATHYWDVRDQAYQGLMLEALRFHGQFPSGVLMSLCKLLRPF